MKQQREETVSDKKQKGENMDSKKKGFTSKWIYGWAFAYIISPYIWLFCPDPGISIGENGLYAGAGGSPILLLGALLLEFLPLIFIVLNFVVVGTQKEKISREQFLNCTILIKYGLLPLYCFGGLLVVFLILITFIPVPFMIFAGPMGALGLSFLGYILLLGSVPFAFAYLTKSRQEKVHARGLTTFAKIAQFIFVLDVVFIMVLSWKEKRWRKLTVTVAALFGLLFFTVCIVVGTSIITLLRGL